jgi:hypothetical protein
VSTTHLHTRTSFLADTAPKVKYIPGLIRVSTAVVAKERPGHGRVGIQDSQVGPAAVVVDVDAKVRPVVNQRGAPRGQSGGWWEWKRCKR